MAFVSVVLGVIGTAVSAIGSIQQGRAAEAEAKYRAQIARRNQEIATDNARRLRERAGVLQEDQDIQNRALLGQQEAVQGASGLSLGGKSQLMTRKSARRLARLDALNIRQEGELSAYNAEVQASNFAAEANLLDMTAKNSKTAGYLGAFSSIIGGARSFIGDIGGFTKPRGIMT